MKFKMAAIKSLKLYFEQQTIIFLSGCNNTNPTIIQNHYIALKLYFEQQTIIFLSGYNNTNPTIIRHHYIA